MFHFGGFNVGHEMMKKTSSSRDLRATSHIWPKVIMMTKGSNQVCKGAALPATAVKAMLALVILTTTFAITDGIATGQGK